MLRVYNTLTKTKEPFETVQPGKVGIYLCGPTVYKPSHIGHMVGPVIFDAIKRYLVYSGYQVTFIVNITDVDDKLIAESNARGIPMAQLAEEMTADYMNNLKAMGIDTVDQFPRCTACMGEIIEFTQDLVDRGFAYEAQGDVYFEVSKSPDYGKLSHRRMEAMQGDGGGMVARKRSGADFALWKSAKADEPSWDSPWGAGRPGWHIECSAMSRMLLGKTFDIHGGGLDLVFPHHENEVAQSECCHGQPMAKYWLHNGLMQASDEVGKIGGRNTQASEGDLASQELGKISKSKGSSPFRELLKQFSPEIIRFFLLSTHYRRPIDYSETRLKEVETGMEAFYRFFKRFERISGMTFYELPVAATRQDGDFEAGNNTLLQAVAENRQHYLEAMDDDFNTGGGIAALFDSLRVLNKYIDDEKLEDPTKRDATKVEILKRGTRAFREMAVTLGLFRTAVVEKETGNDALVGKLMELLIQLRAESRKKKDFATADLIRNRLTEMGLLLEDRPGGTDWTVKS